MGNQFSTALTKLRNHAVSSQSSEPVVVDMSSVFELDSTVLQEHATPTQVQQQAQFLHDEMEALKEYIHEFSIGVNNNLSTLEEAFSNVDVSPPEGTLYPTSHLTGILSMTKGGTGIETGSGTGQNVSELSPGAIMYAKTSTELGQSSPSHDGQFLISGGVDAPSWMTLISGTCCELLTDENTKAITINSTAIGNISSISLSAPSNEFNMSSIIPVTTTGSLSLTRTKQLNYTVLAGPSSLPASIPTFRSLVDTDLPTSVVFLSTQQSISGRITFSTPLTVTSGGTGLNATVVGIQMCLLFVIF